LGRILPEEAVDRIEALPAEGRSEFARRLGDMYQQFKIVRNGPEAKKARAEQMIALLEGEDYEAIAASHDDAVANIRMGISNVANSISRKIQEGVVTQEEIVALIPDAGELAGPDEGREPTEETGEAEELSRAQRNWYHTLFTHFTDTREAYTNKMTGLRPEQQAYLADRLEERLRSAMGRKEGPAKVDRRVEQMRQLIAGAGTEEIAKNLGLNEQLIKKELHFSADTIQRQTPTADLKDIVANALSVDVQGSDAVPGN
jgi:hypothetical protein